MGCDFLSNVSCSSACFSQRVRSFPSAHCSSLVSTFSSYPSALLISFLFFWAAGRAGMCKSRKPGVGKKMHSVFEGVSPRPMCISSPRRLKWQLIRASPCVMSACDANTNAPSSTYKHWRIYTAVSVSAMYSFGRCPRNFPSPNFSFSPTNNLTVQGSLRQQFHVEMWQICLSKIPWGNVTEIDRQRERERDTNKEFWALGDNPPKGVEPLRLGFGSLVANYWVTVINFRGPNYSNISLLLCLLWLLLLF